MAGLDIASLISQLDAGGDPFAPSEQQRKDALNRALMTAGFAMLAGNRSRNPWPAIGMGGMAGLQEHSAALGGAADNKKQSVMLRQQLAQMLRQEQELKRQEASRTAIGAARQAATVAPGIANVQDSTAMDDEGNARPLVETKTPGGFDAQRFSQMVMQNPDVDIEKAMAIGQALSRQQGWRKVGKAPGGGDLYIGPDGKPEVVGKEGASWRPVKVDEKGGVWMQNEANGDLKYVHDTAAKVSQLVGGPKVVLDANAKEGSQYFHREILPRAEASEGQNSRLRGLLRLNLDTNFFTPENKTLKSVLVAVGLGNRDVKEYVGKAEAFQGDVMKLVLDEQQLQKGPQTDKDFMRIQESLPRLRNTPKGNEYLIRMRIAQNNRLMRQATYIGKLTAKGMDYINALEAWKQSPEEKISIFDDPILRGFSFDDRSGGGPIGTVPEVTVGRRIN